MTTTTEIIRSHPSEPRADQGALTAAVNALMECAQACASCADACLAEPGVESLRSCIRANLDCADISQAAVGVLSRQMEIGVAAELLLACRTACRVCADECDLHGQMHEHCRICAEACRRCEDACETLLSSLQVP